MLTAYDHQPSSLPPPPSSTTLASLTTHIKVQQQPPSSSISGFFPYSFSFGSLLACSRLTLSASAALLLSSSASASAALCFAFSSRRRSFGVVLSRLSDVVMPEGRGEEEEEEGVEVEEEEEEGRGDEVLRRGRGAGDEVEGESESKEEEEGSREWEEGGVGPDLRDFLSFLRSLVRGEGAEEAEEAGEARGGVEGGEEEVDVASSSSCSSTSRRRSAAESSLALPTFLCFFSLFSLFRSFPRSSFAFSLSRSLSLRAAFSRPSDADDEDGDWVAADDGRDCWAEAAGGAALPAALKTRAHSCGWLGTRDFITVPMTLAGLPMRSWSTKPSSSSRVSESATSRNSSEPIAHYDDGGGRVAEGRGGTGGEEEREGLRWAQG